MSTIMLKKAETLMTVILCSRPIHLMPLPFSTKKAFYFAQTGDGQGQMGSPTNPACWLYVAIFYTIQTQI
jgi:hypothetical protein